MSKRIWFVTGTDTNIGKTVFAAALTRFLRENGERVGALKPLCSGGREDAKILRAAAGNLLDLDEVNPWHFRAPLSPLLAARKENKRVTLRDVANHVRKMAARFDTLIAEGAGGLLSPLGENFDSRDLLAAINAVPIVVCPNKLGAINQVRLVLAALPAKQRHQAQIVLMSQPKCDFSSRHNFDPLCEFVAPHRLHVFPWLKGNLGRRNNAAAKAIASFLSKQGEKLRVRRETDTIESSS